MFFISSSKAQKSIASNFRELRLQLSLTQEGLATRSGVSLASLRKFEREGNISLTSLLKLALVLGNLEKLIEATLPNEESYASIDEVLKEKKEVKRMRGTIK